jgi:hypothetical protein
VGGVYNARRGRSYTVVCAMPELFMADAPAPATIKTAVPTAIALRTLSRNLKLVILRISTGRIP